MNTHGLWLFFTLFQMLRLRYFGLSIFREGWVIHLGAFKARPIQGVAHMAGTVATRMSLVLISAGSQPAARNWFVCESVHESVCLCVSGLNCTHIKFLKKIWSCRFFLKVGFLILCIVGIITTNFQIWSLNVD